MNGSYVSKVIGQGPSYCLKNCSLVCQTGHFFAHFTHKVDLILKETIHSK